MTNETKKIRKKSGGEESGKKLISMVEGLKSASENYYSAVRAEWANNYGYWQNSEGQGGARYLKVHVKLPIGLAWMVTDGVLASMTDGRPKPVFLPEEKGDIDKAQAVSQIIMGPLWEELRLEELTEEVLKTSLAMSGAAVSRAGIGPDGKLYDHFIDPYHCWPEPGVKKMEDMEFFMTETPQAVGAIKLAFGSAANHVVQEEMVDARRAYMGSFEVAHFWKANNKMPLYDKKKMGEGYSRFRESIGRAFLIHCWMRDYEEGEVPFELSETAEEYQRAMEGLDIRVEAWENHAKHIEQHVRAVREMQDKWSIPRLAERGVPVMPEQMSISSDEMDRDILGMTKLIEHVREHLLYPQAERGLVRPHGREVWICQGEVLSDRPSAFGNPYKAYQFDRDIAGNFWLKSLIIYMVPVQEAFNYLTSKVMAHADLVANGRTYYNARLKILWDKVKEKLQGGKAPIGIMIPTDGPPAGNIFTDYGGEMPGYIFHLMGALEQWAYKLGGFTEVQQGVVPAYASGKAIGSAIQSAGVRIRKGVKHLGWYYQDKFREYIKYLRYADPLTVFRILGKDNMPQVVAWRDIDWDAIEDVRIDVRNVLGTFREMQFEKLSAVMAGNPMLAQIILPALAEYLDVPIDTAKADREGQLENTLGILHDQLTFLREDIKAKK